MTSNVKSQIAADPIGANHEDLVKLEFHRRTYFAYGFAAVCVLVAWAGRSLLGPVVHDRLPLALFVLATLAAALFGGLGPGVASAAAGQLLGDYFFVEPLYTLAPRTAMGWAYCVVFFSETASIIAIVEVLRRSRRRAQNAFSLAQARGEQLRNSLRDIGDAEAKIHELACLLESADDAIISTTLETQVKSWNRGAERLFGFSGSEMIGQSLVRVFPEDRREDMKHLFQKLKQGEHVPVFETVCVRKDGTEIQVSESLSPLRDQRGMVAGALSIVRDIVEFKRINAQALLEQNQALAASRHALEAERSRYRELFNSAPVGYIITTPQGVIQEVNTAAADLLKEAPSSLEGRPLVQWLAREARPAFLAKIGSLARNESGTVENWETTIQPPSGSAFACSLLANRVGEPDGRLIGLRWILRDITERKQVEDRILKLNSELEQRVRERTAALEAANREMEAFSYSVSHDLRAPLRSITGFSKALMQDYHDKLDDEGRLYLQCSHDAGLRMNQLIEDLIELSRSTRRELQQTEVDLSALCEAVLSELRKRDVARQVEVSVAPGLLVHGDEGLLRIALENLLGNAWKFTLRQTRARIEVGSVSQNGTEAFFVKDNGAGFNMAHAKRLFGVFQRLHPQDEFPGTGIGLATVRRIFHRHGGEVWAEAKVNEGATFYFTLPSPMPTAAPAEDEAQAA